MIVVQTTFQLLPDSKQEALKLMRNMVRLCRLEHGCLSYEYFEGVTDPNYIENYGLGMVFRRQVYRRFLFAELEPSYNLRRDFPGQSLSSAWNIILRIELVLSRDLARIPKKSLENRVVPETEPETADQALPPGPR